MPDNKNKKKPYAPYGSDKIDIGSDGVANPKAFPKSREMGKDKMGNETITVRDQAKKVLFSKRDEPIKGGPKESNKFKSDSTNYVNNAAKQAEKFNIGKVASKQVDDNTMAFVGKKKK